ncbi:lipopolysaccharide transport periplasmic protein LptA [Aestuariibacter sp. AA17]|uniref:Lipopolysaccharide export system protein LptA n=1 Tax=Fluctibacter corallii TaxID=2984329 RepID=A0ABT3A4S5_9ALTE|nr:lipopolysaccharide transport periplasmic protein LptA [Aestuariibacter sp. AA17]MCV2883658.1 lipopolysaccharide transport periplasmic protein LptA [Aestuariibacter sp. AA17]
MYKLFTRLISVAYIGSVCLLSFHANAGKDDFNQPIFIDSKSNFFDGKTKTSVFREDVSIKQGTLDIKADEVEVIALAGDGKEIFIARGKPAIYTQKMDDGEKITAKADEIKYEVENRTLTLEGNAELSQKGSMVKTQSIVFNMALQQLIAEGNENEEGRVRTVFQPNVIKQDKNNNEQKGKQ